MWERDIRNGQSQRAGSAEVARGIPQYSRDRPHRGVGDRMPREGFLSFASALRNLALAV